MWRDTIVVFCKRVSNSGDMWFPYYIKGVDVNTDASWLMRNYGEEMAANINLHIPCAIKDDVISIANYTYLKPKEWATKGTDEKADYITFDGGLDNCIVLHGDYDFPEPIMDDDYRQGFFQYLKNNYDGVYQIISARMYSMIPHFELVGR